ncbi:hypothetical protein [Azonexus sp.]|uniref:hypothetical protein n=1 Tax=Azonexus sp. TaxID=1872668 RepID=UPI0027BABC0F|nr:hypothetical protein [Azonexus sp.]
MKNSLQMPSVNRLPTSDELAHGAMLLRSLGEDSLANQLETSHLDESLACQVLVVSDFKTIGDAQVLLVPSGVYQTNAELLAQSLRYIIGLPSDACDYPVLLLDGEAVDVFNTETLEATSLRKSSTFGRFINVIFDAPEPTVLEVYFSDDKQFSDTFFGVEWRPNTDALNIGSNTFYHGRDWALAAYGSFYRGRNALERGLDSVHEGTMNAIDTTFGSLVKLGEKIDRFFS